MNPITEQLTIEIIGKTFAEQFGVSPEGYEGIKIDGLLLSNRTRTALKRCGMDNVGKLLQISNEQLGKMRGLGQTSFRELHEKLLNEDVLSNRDSLLSQKKEAVLVNEDSEMTFAEAFDIDVDELPHVMVGEFHLSTKTFDALLRANMNTLKDLLLLSPKELRGLKNMGSTKLQELQQKILNKEYLAKASAKDLDQPAGEEPMSKDIGREIELFFDSMKELTLFILEERAKGRTLEDIGNEKGLTRERVRQLEARQIKRFKEDGLLQRLIDEYMLKVSNKWIITEKSLAIISEQYQSCLWFVLKTIANNKKEQEQIYYNDDLEIIIIKETVEEAEQDIDALVREAIASDDENNTFLKSIAGLAKKRYDKYIYVGNQVVERNRDAFLRHIIRAFVDKPMRVDDIYELYHKAVREQELGEDFVFPSKSGFNNKLARLDYVLNSTGNSARYFDTTQFSAEQIAEGLNIEQYNNKAITTLKLFRENEELMNDWDIRDEYELHNLMRKVMPSANYTRSPGVSFGEADRDEQFIELLKETSPIEALEFYQLYEDMYGDKAETLGANQGVYKQYLVNGVLDIGIESDDVGITAEEEQKLSAALDGDLYTFNQVHIVANRVLGSSAEKVGPKTIKHIGFNVLGNVAFRYKNNNFTSFLKEYVQKQDIFNLKQLEPEIRNRGVTKKTLDELEREGILIEIEKGEYISRRRLTECGVGSEQLTKFADDVYNFAGNEYFTIYSLEKEGMELPFGEIGMDTFFYEKLLKLDGRFSYNKNIPGRTFFRRGNTEILTSDCIEKYVFDSPEGIDIYDLIYEIKSDFGFGVSREKILEWVEQKDFYFNKILEKLYIDYDYYLEGIS